MKTLKQLVEENFSRQEQADIRRKAGEKIAAVRLRKVRQSQRVTQRKLAQAMGLSQPALSELERRPNITLETLQRYVEALGGRLEIRAVFQQGTEELLA